MKGNGKENGDMETKEHIQNALKQLFSSQYLAVLATQDKGQPYTSLVAFAATDDLKSLLFVTAQSTRKYANLKADSRAAMLIDSRSNQASDISHAMAATATGTTEDVSKEEVQYKKFYLSKHPHLEEFIDSPSTAFIKLNVEHYYVVSKFQEVMELHIEQ